VDISPVPLSDCRFLGVDEKPCVALKRRSLKQAAHLIGGQRPGKRARRRKTNLTGKLTEKTAQQRCRRYTEHDDISTSRLLYATFSTSEGWISTPGCCIVFSTKL